VNTGNNLAYLLCSMLLAVITVSGALSDLSLRGLRVRLSPPDEVYAGRPALFSLVLANGKRWLPSHSLDVEVTGGRPGVLHVARVGPGGERVGATEVTLPRRGRHPAPPLRIATRFPFGLFAKTWPARAETEILVFPAVEPVSRERLRELGAAGEGATRRRGPGHELSNLRPYRPGDEPRMIHWPTTARAGVTTVRETEEESALDTRIVLTGTGARNARRLESGLAEAASLAVHLIGAGVAVTLHGPGVRVALGRGRGQEQAILTALALYEPPSTKAATPGSSVTVATGAAGDARRDRSDRGRPLPAARELRVSLD
jgi:uncharacterized protein (DUF58 family)